MGEAKRRRDAGAAPRGGGRWAVPGERLFRAVEVPFGVQYEPVRWEALAGPSREASGLPDSVKPGALVGLSACVKEQGELADRVRTLVAKARRQGRTWQQIGDALGVTEQAAHKRYRRSG